MTIFEIDQKIIDCFDENGEIVNQELFDELLKTRNAKIEWLGLQYKNLTALSFGIAKEIDELQQRKRRTESRIDSIKNYLKEILKGSDFETAKLKIGHRRSVQVKFDEDKFVDWAQKNDKSEFLTEQKNIKINKKAVKDALKNGAMPAFAWLEDCDNLQIT